MSYINETEITCVKLPANVCPTSSVDHPRFLSIIRIQQSSLALLGTGLPFFPEYEVIARACRERAMLTVDGSLRVNARRIEPDKYLLRWRKALKKAVPISGVIVEFWRCPVAVLEWKHAELLEQIKPRWVEPPYRSFGELLQAHEAQVSSFPRRADLSEPEDTGANWSATSEASATSGTSMRRLQIDLASPNGARDAWWAEDFLSDRAAANSKVSVRMELRRPSPVNAYPVSGGLTHGALDNWRPRTHFLSTPTTVSRVFSSEGDQA